MITAAHLTLGYIYYELGFFKESIRHFAEIPRHDEAYTEGLLARGWSAIKLNDYQQAIITLNELIKATDDEKYTEEAHFMLGQCYLELGFFDFAVKEFDIIVEQYAAANHINDRVLEVERGMIEQRRIAEQMRIDLLLLETKLLELIPIERLDNRNAIPGHLEAEKRKIDESREMLVQRILEERKRFDDFQWQMEELKEEIERRRSRRHWRSYAEYGKARAYFLKTMSGR